LVFHRGKNTQKSPKEKILRAVITRGFWSMTTWQAVRPWP
jgi:SOS response regulatory protein OraA/RecX